MDAEKHTEKKLNGDCTRMLRVILNKSWKEHPTKQQLYGHLYHYSKTIQIRRTKHAEPWLRIKNSLVTFSFQPVHMDVPVLAEELTGALYRHGMQFIGPAWSNG